MPTFVLDLALFTPLMLPSTRALLSPTMALAPIAVAFLRPSAASHAKPMHVMSQPVVLEVSVLTPLAVLLLPVVLEPSAPAPLAVLLSPVVLGLSASAPLAVFWVPVVL